MRSFFLKGENESINIRSSRWNGCHGYRISCNIQMKYGCNIAPQSFSELGWHVLPFFEDDDYKDRKITYWHVENKSIHLELHHQVAIFYKAFTSINYLMNPYRKQFLSTSDPDKASILIRFRTDEDDLPLKFQDGVLAYAVPNEIWVNDDYFWHLTDSDKGKDLQIVLEHEIGHVLGLGHTEEDNDIMRAEYNPENYWTEDSKLLLTRRYSDDWERFIEALKNNEPIIEDYRKDRNDYIVIAIFFILSVIAILWLMS